MLSGSFYGNALLILHLFTLCAYLTLCFPESGSIRLKFYESMNVCNVLMYRPESSTLRALIENEKELLFFLIDLIAKSHIFQYSVNNNL